MIIKYITIIIGNIIKYIIEIMEEIKGAIIGIVYLTYTLNIRDIKLIALNIRVLNKIVPKF